MIEIEGMIHNLNGHQDVITNVNKINKKLLDNNIDVFALFDKLLDSKKEETFILMTFIIKKRKLYDLKYSHYYEKWLYHYVDSWGKCDAYCYRVLNPMVESYSELYDHVIQWAHSNQTYVKRAALVCFIVSKSNFYVDYDLQKILNICNILKADEHIHIQKGLGWLLKYSYLAYPSEIEKYLRDNVNQLSRTTFRYALEKMPKELKDKLMAL